MSPERYRGGGGFDDYRDPAEDRAFRYRQEEAARNERAYAEDEKRDIKQREQSEVLPYLFVSLNNRRVSQPFSQGPDHAETDPIAEAMNGRTSHDTKHIIGPLFPVSAELLKEVSPLAFEEVREWYEAEQKRRTEGIKKHDPQTLAGPAELQSLADLFKKKRE